MPRPPIHECDAFMAVIGKATAVRAEIHREAASADKARDWAARTKELADSARALALTDPDLIAESASLASRMGDLARDLGLLATAEKGKNAAARATAHDRVIKTSEQVEVIAREPAARCAGDTRKLIATSGRLAPAAIQSVVVASFPRLGACYVEGQKRDASLRGRVDVRFVVGTDGKVSEARSAEASEPIPADAIAPPSTSTLPPMPDKKVVECIVNGFRSLVFPKPEGGAVTVIYPIILAPE